MRNSAPKEPLDRIDRAILAALQKDGRLTNKELAALVGLSPSSCLERVRRLQRDGTLRGFHADVDPAALGVALEAVVMIQLSSHSREVVEAFRRHTAALPQVRALYYVAGRQDFLVHIAARDAEDLRSTVLDAFGSRPEVRHVETALVFDHHRGYVLPDYLG